MTGRCQNRVMGIGWRGQRVALVPLDKSKHMDNAWRWVNDPEVTRWLLIGDYPTTRAMEEAWFDAHDAVNPKEIHFAIETLEGLHIGQCGIHSIDYVSGAATTGLFIGPPEYRGKGFGRDAATVRTHYAFEVLGLRMLYVEVFAENEASIRNLKRLGYEEYGRCPARYWRRGAYRDTVELVLTREKFSPQGQ